jgi:hypothetical protein
MYDHLPEPMAKVCEALEECLREHGGFTIKGQCERRACEALKVARAYRPAPDVREALESLLGVCETEGRYWSGLAGSKSADALTKGKAESVAATYGVFADRLRNILNDTRTAHGTGG